MLSRKRGNFVDAGMACLFAIGLVATTDQAAANTSDREISLTSLGGLALGPLVGHLRDIGAADIAGKFSATAGGWCDWHTTLNRGRATGVQLVTEHRYAEALLDLATDHQTQPIQMGFAIVGNPSEPESVQFRGTCPAGDLLLRFDRAGDATVVRYDAPVRSSRSRSRSRQLRDIAPTWQWTVWALTTGEQHHARVVRGTYVPDERTYRCHPTRQSALPRQISVSNSAEIAQLKGVQRATRPAGPLPGEAAFQALVRRAPTWTPPVAHSRKPSNTGGDIILLER